MLSDFLTSSNIARRARPGLRSPRLQTGVTFAGLLVYGLFVAAGVFLVMQVLPSVTEFQAVKTTIEKVAQGNPPTVEDARRMFDRQRTVDPSIQSITGEDLIVTKENGRVVVAVKYEKELHMVGPVSLLIRYEASTR